MLRVVVAVVTLIVVVIIAYFVGHDRGQKYCAKHLHQPPEYWEQLTELDRSFLSNIVTRPNELTSGTYVLDIRFPGQSKQTHMVDLVFEDGKLLKAPNPSKNAFVTHALAQEANVISWTQADPDEGPSANYVGLIDGQLMWGKVYVPRGTGWHQNPPAIGDWMLYPNDRLNEKNKAE